MVWEADPEASCPPGRNGCREWGSAGTFHEPQYPTAGLGLKSSLEGGHSLAMAYQLSPVS